jgi:hypothetical protein
MPEELFAVPEIEVDDRTYRELELLAVAWNTTIRDVVDRLVLAPATGAGVLRTRPALPPVAVHAVYAGTRIEALFERDSAYVTVCSGPLSGQTYTSPSGARRAVVALLNPAVSPTGSGWVFWKVTGTGARLETLRR